MEQVRDILLLKIIPDAARSWASPATM